MNSEPPHALKGAESARRAGLSYLAELPPGIQRRKAGDGWCYLRSNGARMTSAAALHRIEKLAIPPAWTDVWIAPSGSAHLQAVGYDVRGRRQYIYHPAFLAARNQWKFDRLGAFGAALPGLRRRASTDLRQRRLSKDKVLAAIVVLLDRTAVRIGSPEYLHANGSFGLTTLLRKHVSVDSGKVSLRFKGKSGVVQEVELADERIVRAIRQCLRLKGGRLFQYVDGEGRRRNAGARDVNDYIRRYAGGRFSAKDFRTWAGTCVAYETLCAAPAPQSRTEAVRTLAAAVKLAAERLGNQPTTSREFYVHPSLVELYLDNWLDKTFSPIAQTDMRVKRGRNGLTAGEQRVVAIVNRWGRGLQAIPGRRKRAGPGRGESSVAQ